MDSCWIIRKPTLRNGDRDTSCREGARIQRSMPSRLKCSPTIRFMPSKLPSGGTAPVPPIASALSKMDYRNDHTRVGLESVIRGRRPGATAIDAVQLLAEHIEPCDLPWHGLGSEEELSRALPCFLPSLFSQSVSSLSFSFSTPPPHRIQCGRNPGQKTEKFPVSILGSLNLSFTKNMSFGAAITKVGQNKPVHHFHLLGVVAVGVRWGSQRMMYSRAKQ